MMRDTFIMSTGSLEADQRDVRATTENARSTICGESLSPREVSIAVAVGLEVVRPALNRSRTSIPTFIGASAPTQMPDNGQPVSTQAPNYSSVPTQMHIGTGRDGAPASPQTGSVPTQMPVNGPPVTTQAPNGQPVPTQAPNYSSVPTQMLIGSGRNGSLASPVHQRHNGTGAFVGQSCSIGTSGYGCCLVDGTNNNDIDDNIYNLTGVDSSAVLMSSAGALLAALTASSAASSAVPTPSSDGSVPTQMPVVSPAPSQASTTHGSVPTQMPVVGPVPTQASTVRPSARRRVPLRPDENPRQGRWRLRGSKCNTSGDSVTQSGATIRSGAKSTSAYLGYPAKSVRSSVDVSHRKGGNSASAYVATHDVSLIDFSVKDQESYHEAVNYPSLNVKTKAASSFVTQAAQPNGDDQNEVHLCSIVDDASGSAADDIINNSHCCRIGPSDVPAFLRLGAENGTPLELDMPAVRSPSLGRILLNGQPVLTQALIGSAVPTQLPTNGQPAVIIICAVAKLAATNGGTSASDSGASDSGVSSSGAASSVVSSSGAISSGATSSGATSSRVTYSGAISSGAIASGAAHRGSTVPVTLDPATSKMMPPNTSPASSRTLSIVQARAARSPANVPHRTGEKSASVYVATRDVSPSDFSVKDPETLREAVYCFVFNFNSLQLLGGNSTKLQTVLGDVVELPPMESFAAIDSGVIDSGVSDSGASNSGTSISAAIAGGANDFGATSSGATASGATASGATASGATASGVVRNWSTPPVASVLVASTKLPSSVLSAPLHTCPTVQSRASKRTAKPVICTHSDAHRLDCLTAKRICTHSDAEQKPPQLGRPAESLRSSVDVSPRTGGNGAWADVATHDVSPICEASNCRKFIIGFGIILLSDTSILWKSQPQISTASSFYKAEYVAIRHVLEEICSMQQTALDIIKSRSITKMIKHVTTRFQRTRVVVAAGTISQVKVDNKLSHADSYTKQLPAPAHSWNSADLLGLSAVVPAGEV